MSPINYTPATGGRGEGKRGLLKARGGKRGLLKASFDTVGIKWTGRPARERIYARCKKDEMKRPELS
jgi:hypothetical protein